MRPVVTLLAWLVGRIQEPLVVAEVEVRFGPVVRHVAFPVLDGVEGARVDVEVGVEFLNGHRQAASL